MRIDPHTPLRSRMDASMEGAAFDPSRGDAMASDTGRAAAAPSAAMEPQLRPSVWHLDASSRFPLVVVLSLLAHGMAAYALTLLPAEVVAELESVVAIEFGVAAPAALAVAPLPIEEPLEAVAPERAAEPAPAPMAREARVRPEPAPAAAPPPAAEPPPAAAAVAAPPSLDDVFGEPSAGPAEVMTGGAGPAVASSPGGRPGGRAGGTGTGIGAGGGAQTAPSGPSEAEVRAARRAYVRALEALLRAQARYPREARRDGHQGRVELALRVGRDGRLLEVRVATSSGFDELDAAALEAARRLSPPSPPDIVPWGAAQEVRAPVLYVLR